jgi:hypothetical protein
VSVCDRPKRSVEARGESGTVLRRCIDEQMGEGVGKGVCEMRPNE